MLHGSGRAGMALIAIGDVQGCDAALGRLLARLPADARLIFVGDLVNRGPESLAVLRRVRAMGERAVAVLGNHDLHLLAVAEGIRPEHADDTLAEVLAAPDAAELLRWLRQRPLIHAEAGALFVHAGLLPDWSAEQALALAGEVQERLRGADFHSFLAAMYGNRPPQWDPGLTGDDRLRCILNACTRLRYVTAAGAMDLKLKGAPALAPAGALPWFLHPQRASRGSPVVFGHWSTLGLMLGKDAVAIDTGCVWGRQLTGLAWPQRTVVQVPGEALPAGTSAPDPGQEG
jgi:bis(5'-nucleosyl)-tetraphosphatase (symmetrical)